MIKTENIYEVFYKKINYLTSEIIQKVQNFMIRQIT